MNEVENEFEEKLHEVEKLYKNQSVFDRLRTLSTGLGKPRSSREYKAALIELQRLASPLCAILLPTIFLAALFVLTATNGKDKRIQNVEIVQAEDEQEIEETPPETPQEMDQMDQVELDVAVDMDVAVDVQTPIDTPKPELAPTLQNVDAVMDVRSPVTLKSAFGDNRTAARRAHSLANYGGSRETEACVMRALRWLKTKQLANGSWPGSSGADGMSPTGLAILTFLSHGEKPGGSKEFGDTVQKGVEYLMQKSNPDAAELHALAETYGLTGNPNIKTVAIAKLNALADRLANTKWGPPMDGTDNVLPRLLPMTFQTMALRSAQLSRFDLPNMDRALVKLREGFLHQADMKNGGFSDDHWGKPGANYRRTGTWHFMVGVVAMQYLGQINNPVIEKTLKILDDDWEPPTLDTTDIACCPVRGNYWATMVFFNNGGKRWLAWNQQMKKVYVGGQHVVKESKYLDAKGVAQDIGYWSCEDMHISRDPVGVQVITTCYVAQQLMVYYRYLPTSKAEAWNAAAKKEKPVSAAAADDVQVGGLDDI